MIKFIFIVVLTYIIIAILLYIREYIVVLKNMGYISGSQKGGIFIFSFLWPIILFETIIKHINRYFKW